jgi:hypothetical protein
VDEVIVVTSIEKDNLHWICSNIYTQNWAAHTLTNWFPTDQQLRVLSDKSQYRLVAGGRRVGKTDIIVVDSISNAVRNANTECVILTPYNNVASIIVSAIMDRIETSPIVRKQLTRIERQSIYFNNGSSIKVRKYDRAADANLRECSFLYIDEVFRFVSQSPRFLTNIIDYRPEVKIMVVGTPMIDSINNIDPRFSLHRMPMMECSMVNREMIESMRSQLDEPLFRIEVLGELL